MYCATDVVGRFVRRQRRGGQDVWTVYILYYNMYTHNAYIHNTTLAGRDNVAVSRVRAYNIITVRTRARAHSEPDDGGAESEKGRPSGFRRRLISLFSVVGGGRRRGVGRPDGVCPTYGRRSSTRHGSRPAHVEHVAHTFARVS